MLRRQLTQRVHGIARARALRLDGEHLGARHIACSEPCHCNALLRGRRAFGQLLVRRNTRRNEQQSVQLQRLTGALRRVHMPDVRRIIGAAQYADPRHARPSSILRFFGLRA